MDRYSFSPSRPKHSPRRRLREQFGRIERLLPLLYKLLMNLQRSIRQLFACAAACALSLSASVKADTHIGGGLHLLPGGTFEISNGTDSESQSLGTAFGMTGLVDFDVHPNLSIGVAPRLILNIKPEGETDAAKQFDLAVRFTGGAPVGAGNIRMFGFLAPGYSTMFFPNSDSNIDNPAGVVLGFGGGLAFALQPGLELTGELGYQMGFQSVSVNGETFGITTDFMHVGIGILAAL